MPYLSALEIHASARRNALSKFTMPAMSPTMTEGGIAEWKVKEGQKYSAGDVLLEIVHILFFHSVSCLSRSTPGNGQSYYRCRGARRWYSRKNYRECSQGHAETCLILSPSRWTVLRAWLSDSPSLSLAKKVTTSRVLMLLPLRLRVLNPNLGKVAIK